MTADDRDQDAGIAARVLALADELDDEAAVSGDDEWGAASVRRIAARLRAAVEEVQR